MKLTEKSAQVFECVKANGGKVSVEEICNTLDRGARSVTPNITDLVKKGLVVREKVAGEGEDAKDITYVVMTDNAEELLAAPDAE